MVTSRTLRADNYGLSEETKRLRDHEQARLTDGAYSEAVRLIEKHRASLDRLRQASSEGDPEPRRGARARRRCSRVAASETVGTPRAVSPRAAPSRRPASRDASGTPSCGDALVGDAAMLRVAAPHRRLRVSRLRRQPGCSSRRWGVQARGRHPPSRRRRRGSRRSACHLRAGCSARRSSIGRRSTTRASAPPPFASAPAASSCSSRSARHAGRPLPR